MGESDEQPGGNSKSSGDGGETNGDCASKLLAEGEERVDANQAEGAEKRGNVGSGDPRAKENPSEGDVEGHWDRQEGAENGDRDYSQKRDGEVGSICRDELDCNRTEQGGQKHPGKSEQGETEKVPEEVPNEKEETDSGRPGWLRKLNAEGGWAGLWQ